MIATVNDDYLTKLKAVQTPVEPQDTMAEAGRKVLLADFVKLLNNEGGVRIGDDIEFVHDMRVATRRMRSTFRLLDSFYKDKPIRPFVQGLQTLARALGSVRDLDVMIADLTTTWDTLDSDGQAALGAVIQKLDRQRGKARKKLIKHLDSKTYAGFVEAFTAFLTKPGRGARSIDVANVQPHEVRHVVPALLHDMLATVRAYDGVLTQTTVVTDEDGTEREVWATPDVETFHALRIEFKRLRYAVAAFRDVLGAKGDAFIVEIKVIQDHLGRLNDIVVLRQSLSDLIDDGLMDKADLTDYLDQLEAEQISLIEGFPAVWSRFNTRTVQSKLSNALLVLR